MQTDNPPSRPALNVGLRNVAGTPPAATQPVPRRLRRILSLDDFETAARHAALREQLRHARGTPIVSANVERDFSDRGHLNWDHFALIRRMWKGTLIVKGILSPHDARLARDHGADGIIVSNHGGRQLDGAVAPLRILPAIVAACPELPVMMDSGVRRGTDALKALALGAKLVFVGRPFGFAAAVAGEQGVSHAIAIPPAGGIPQHGPAGHFSAG
jgi:L-lactate dehydrogenase (cytochrome)